jgi:hypothetical protein
LAASATLSRVSCFSVVPPRSDSETVERLSPVTSAMVRNVTRWFAPDLVLLLIVSFPTRFYTGITRNQTAEILQRYIFDINVSETISKSQYTDLK